MVDDVTGGLVAPEIAQEIEAERAAVSEYAHSLVVDSPERYREGGEYLVRCARAIKRIKEIFDPLAEAANEAHKRITSRRAAMIAPFLNDQGVINPKLVGWKREQDRLAAEEARRAEEENQRIADEQRLKLAEKAEKIGDTATAEALAGEFGRPSPSPTARPSAYNVPKVAGMSTRSNWLARPAGVSPLHDLVQAAAKNPQLLQYLEPSMQRINALAKAQRESFTLPGFESYDAARMSVRSK